MAGNAALDLVEGVLGAERIKDGVEDGVEGVEGVVGVVGGGVVGGGVVGVGVVAVVGVREAGRWDELDLESVSRYTERHIL